MPRFSVEVRVKSNGVKGVASTANFLSLEEAKNALDRLFQEKPPEGTKWDDLEVLEVFFDDKDFTQDTLMAMAVNEFILGKKAAGPINAAYLEWFKVNAPSSCLTKALKLATDTRKLVLFCEALEWQM